MGFFVYTIIGGMMKLHTFYMKRALYLASKATGWVSPNPMVGAVLVKDGAIVGEGYHKKAGGSHAEIFCLKEAKKKANGATLYVNLEPCSHFGRTPPCTEAIIKAGVSKVVIAMTDPNPLVAGKGIEMLKRNGIEVIEGILEREAKQLNEVFIKYITTGFPFIAVKIAATLDGKIATKTNSSKWITGELARQYVHELRHQYDAILVGINTILNDNPSLNCRLSGKKKNPIRIVLDNNLQIPLDAKVIKSAETPLIIFTVSDHSEKINKLNKLGAEVIVQNGKTKIDIKSVLKVLARKQITSILVEGGSEILWTFFANGLVDKFYKFVAPKIIGGKSSIPIVGGEGVDVIESAIKMKWHEVKFLGDDILMISYREL
jgi:diaminohydroxyphosphoribosylaminopyrimidine deaminase/5-amino-6-(5-phosphoribosylamino)uracil reductase